MTSLATGNISSGLSSLQCNAIKLSLSTIKPGKGMESDKIQSGIILNFITSGTSDRKEKLEISSI
jgi:hypothetical protein